MTQKKSNKLVCFDIDGVVLKGATPIPGASEAIHFLEENGIPYIFLSNGCPTTETIRAKQLSQLLNIHCTPEMVIMAQTPLCELVSEHDKLHLVVNQGDCRAIIEATGFKNVITIEELSKKYPLLDSLDRSVYQYGYEKKSCLADDGSDYCSKDSENDDNSNRLGKIEGIILLEDPINWESAYQFILDILFTDGDLNKDSNFNYLNAIRHIREPTIPIYVGSSDFFSVTAAPWPRISHGSFLVGLEAIYKKITGKPLQYKKLYGKPNLSVYQFLYKRIQALYPNIDELYILGDNPLTDIYGANVFKNLIQDKNYSLKMTSVLVKTGIYSGNGNDDVSASVTLLSDYTPKEPRYLNSDFIVQNTTEFIEKFSNILLDK